MKQKIQFVGNRCGRESKNILSAARQDIYLHGNAQIGQVYNNILTYTPVHQYRQDMFVIFHRNPTARTYHYTYSAFDCILSNIKTKFRW